MTVCIAVISPETRRVFMVTDGKFSDGTFGLDTKASKSRQITKDQRWFCCFSCTDSTRFDSLYPRIRTAISNQGDGPHDLDTITDCVTAAYGDELLAMMAAAKRLGGAGKKASTGVQLMVVGFDSADTPHLRYFDGFGKYQSWDHQKYGAIGEYHAALASLLSNLDFRGSSDVGLIVYRMCEAKFLAESLDSVGTESTSVISAESDGTITILTDDIIDRARALWKRRREARLPLRLRRCLGGGFTIDSSGDDMLLKCERIRNETSLVYQRVTQEIEALRRLNLLTPDQWHRADLLSRSIDSLSEQIARLLEEWWKTFIRPSGLENLLKWYSDKVTELSNIRATPPQSA